MLCSFFKFIYYFFLFREEGTLFLGGVCLALGATRLIPACLPIVHAKLTNDDRVTTYLPLKVTISTFVHVYNVIVS